MKKYKDLLIREFNYYNKIRENLNSEHKEGFVVIKDQKILGVWNDRGDALKAGLEKFGDVPFLVKDINNNKVINISRDIEFV